MDAELQVLREHQPDMVCISDSCFIIIFDPKHLSLQPLDELRRRLAIIDNELTKEKSASRRYQVATEKLMQFVEV